MEKWINGYEGLYSVTSDGDIVSYRSGKPHVMSSCLAGRGYKMVPIVKDGKVASCYIHRAVAEAFIPNPGMKPCINHKDENKLNNSIENLEWCTYHENNVYGTRMERIVESRKKTPVSEATREKMRKSHIGLKIGGKKVRCIETGEVYKSAREAALHFGMNKCSVSSVCGTKYTAHGYHWEYVND